MTLPLYSDLPDTIAPRDCIAVVYSCLSAPACSPNVRGLEVIYSAANGWRKEVR